MDTDRIIRKLKDAFPQLYVQYCKFTKTVFLKKLYKDKHYLELKKRACSLDKTLHKVTNFIDELVAFSDESKYDYYDAVIHDRLISVTTKWVKCTADDPIFICAVKNDLQRVRIQMAHLRKLGIKHMVYIDNGSNDGTFEWLSNQNDVNLYETNAKFNALRKSIWIRMIVNIYGYNRWYLICDSDELFEYPKCERFGIKYLIRLLEKHNLSSVCAMMLDMYTNETFINQKCLTDSEILEKYCWIDVDTYVCSDGRHDTNIIAGGPRTRLFFYEDKPLTLSKYPLVKLQPDMFHATHILLSEKIKPDKKLHAVLKHYKFLYQDNIRYAEIIKDGNYFHGSREYKTYLKILKDLPESKFFYEKSVKYMDSATMLKINIFDGTLYDEWSNS